MIKVRKERENASLKASRRSNIERSPHRESKIQCTYMNQHPFENILPSTQMRASHSSGFVGMSERAFPSLSSKPEQLLSAPATYSVAIAIDGRLSCIVSPITPPPSFRLKNIGPQPMRLQVNQSTPSRYGRMARRRHSKCQSKKVAQCKRNRRPPCNASFGIQSFKVADPKHAEVYAASQSRAPHPGCIEFPASLFDKIIKSVLLQDGIQLSLKWVRRRFGYFAGRNPKCFFPLLFSLSDCHGVYFTANPRIWPYDISYN